MNKRLREKLDSWDLRSVVLTFVFLSVALFIFFYFTDIRDRLRTEERDRFKGETKGEIVRIEKMDRISQSKRNGTKIYIDSYRVTYTFIANGQMFRCMDIIPATTKNLKLIAEILETKESKMCLVRYDTENPNKSLLIDGE